MNPYLNQYKKAQVQTASPEQILIMLYDGAIRFLNQAKIHMQNKDIEQSHTNIIKAQRIITEFMSSLDMELGGEMAENLFNLYEYLHHRLVQANIKKDVEALDEVLEHLRSLKATWEEAIKIAAKEKDDSMGDDYPDTGTVYASA
ncbi:MAG: flagellar export chaperone FliS [Vampirovibrionia bacterium]